MPISHVFLLLFQVLRPENQKLNMDLLAEALNLRHFICPKLRAARLRIKSNDRVGNCLRAGHSTSLKVLLGGRKRIDFEPFVRTGNLLEAGAVSFRRPSLCRQLTADGK